MTRIVCGSPSCYFNGEDRECLKSEVSVSHDGCREFINTVNANTVIRHLIEKGRLEEEDDG